MTASNQSDFPPKLSAPALRALQHAKISNVAALAKYTEHDILAMHGIGPASIPLLRAALKKQGLRFSKS